MKRSNAVDIFYVYAVMIGMLDYAKSVAEANDLDEISTACGEAQETFGKEKDKVKGKYFQNKSPDLPTNIDTAAQEVVDDIKEYLDKHKKDDMSDKDACEYVLTSTSVLLKYAFLHIQKDRIAKKVDKAHDAVVSKLDVMKLDEPTYENYRYCIDRGFTALNILNDRRQRLYN